MGSLRVLVNPDKICLNFWCNNPRSYSGYNNDKTIPYEACENFILRSCHFGFAHKFQITALNGIPLSYIKHWIKYIGNHQLLALMDVTYLSGVKDTLLLKCELK